MNNFSQPFVGLQTCGRLFSWGEIMLTIRTHVSRLTDPDFPVGNVGNWQERHRAALFTPRENEAGIVGMVKMWLHYADMHQLRFESSIGEDGILGDEWSAIGRGLLGLLNGETGRLDCGILDGCIRGALVAEGFGDE